MLKKEELRSTAEESRGGGRGAAGMTNPHKALASLSREDLAPNEETDTAL